MGHYRDSHVRDRRAEPLLSVKVIVLLSVVLADAVTVEFLIKGSVPADVMRRLVERRKHHRRRA